MKTKVIGILVCMLLIATALPVVGTINEVKEGQNKSAFIKNQEADNGNVCFLHDPVIEWERLYGGPNDEVFRNVKQTSDGGYITVGVWNSTSHWLVKVDADGNEEWNVTALPNSTLWPRCYIVEQTSDGGFITAGCHEDTLGFGYNRCVWKVDENGTTEWLKIYDDPLYGYHMCIQQTTDEGYIVSGEIDVSQGDWDVLLMKINSTGDIEWQQIYKYSEFGDNAYAVRQTPDGGYILSGRKENTASEADLLVIKTDSNGEVEWDNTYGGAFWEWTQCNDILLASDGGYLFLGETASFGAGSRDLWLVKTDADGNMEWNKTFGGRRWDMAGGMDFTDDGGIIIAGTFGNNEFMPPKGEGLVIKTDENGILEWQKTFGYEELDQLQSVYTTSDGGYIVAGDIDSTESAGAGLIDGWLIKLEAFENNPPDKPDKPSGPESGEPETEYTYSSSTSDSNGDQIFYLWDWGDGNLSDWLGPYDSGDTCEASYTWAEEGEYDIKVMSKDEHGAESDWSDPLPIEMPQNIEFNYNYNLIEWFFEHYPNAFPLLRQTMEF